MMIATLDNPPLKEFSLEPIDPPSLRSEGEAFAKISHGISVVVVHKISHLKRL